MEAYVKIEKMGGEMRCGEMISDKNTVKKLSCSYESIHSKATTKSHKEPPAVQESNAEAVSAIRKLCGRYIVFRCSILFLDGYY